MDGLRLKNDTDCHFILTLMNLVFQFQSYAGVQDL